MGTSLLKLTTQIVLVASMSGIAFGLAQPKPADPHKTSNCEDSVFRFQSNFWLNLHLFLRAETRRRSLHLPLEMPEESLSSVQEVAWKQSMDSYDDLAKGSLFDEDSIRIANTLAGQRERIPPKSPEIAPTIIQALNGAAPAYRDHLWQDHQRQDDAWIAANCADIRRDDVEVKREIARVFHAQPPKEIILVDLARETGPTLAYTTAGPAGTSGHTILAPQKSGEHLTALNTIFHEISHTIVDQAIIDAINSEAARQHVNASRDLWHAVTLYTTTEITKRVLAEHGIAISALDEERQAMFKRNGWIGILSALELDWQPYLNNRIDEKGALSKLVHDTST